MNELAADIAAELRAASHLQCNSISISSYGALQLGFGAAIDRLIAGKYANKSYALEVGTYFSSWKYLRCCGQFLSCKSDEALLRSEILGSSIGEIHWNEKEVMLSFNNEGKLFIDTRHNGDDVFYAFSGDEICIFYNDSDGWIVEKCS